MIVKSAQASSDVSLMHKKTCKHIFARIANMVIKFLGKSVQGIENKDEIFMQPVCIHRIAKVDKAR